jgi:hypothetical protein
MASRDDVGALLRKYEEITRLRRVEAAGLGGDPRREMAALASEFPGALREADDLPMAELEARVDALREAVTGAVPPAPWMQTMARFHALMRGALCAKRWLLGRKDVDAAVTKAFDAEAATLCYGDDAREWSAHLGRLASPPNGRVTELVFQRLADELGGDADQVRRVVFGERRSRY